MNANRNSNVTAILETLENRQLLSASLFANLVMTPEVAQAAVVKPVAKATAPTTNKTTTSTTKTATSPTSPALTINQASITGGTELQITGTTGNDQITIKQNGTAYTITNGTWSTTVTGVFKDIKVRGNGGNDSIILDASVTTNAILYGGAGNDTITGGSGNDQIFAGAGSNLINGGAGNDTIVTLGSTADTITGGAGTDTFWIDDSKTENVTDMTASELAKGTLHKVGSFMSVRGTNGIVTTISKDLLGQSLVDPATTDRSMTYKNFANVPLFGATGPAEDDIVQGYVGDCYFLSVLSSVAKIDPDRIRQSIVDLGDGTFAVQFSKANGTKTFVRVDSDLPTYGYSAAYASASKVLWVALIEKAFAEYRTGTADYNAINGGWMDESYTALGVNNSTSIWYANDGNSLLNQINSAVLAGQSVTYATASAPAGSNLVAGHAYTVDHVARDASGNLVLVLRNPWGIDGYSCNDGRNDGYITITAAQAKAAMVGVQMATV